MSNLREIARYEYTNASGDLLYTQVRFVPKDFRPQMPDGTWGLATQRVLYRLPELLEGMKHHTVWITEGEKDADRLVKHGFTATTTGAASSWGSTDTSPLHNARAIAIVPDADKAGRQYADKVALSLYQHTPVRVVKLVGPKGYDVSDYLNEGNRAMTLIDMLDRAPYWEPPRHMRVKRKRYRRGKAGLPWDVGDITYALGGKMYGADRGVAYCPAHDDQGSENMGLSLSATMDGRTVAHCHSGCDFRSISRAVRRAMQGAG